MKKVKISTRQLMIIFIVMIYSPSERFLSKYLSSKALQAGWISPIITAVLFVVFMYIISFLLKKYKSIGFAGIILRVLGPFYGRVLLLFYLVWITFLNSFYLRFYGERLITSIYSNTNMSIFIIIMLIVITIVIKKGIVIMTRMAEIIFYISTFFFVVLFFVTLPTIEIELLTPISIKIRNVNNFSPG